MQSLDEIMPMVIACLRRRHPELVVGLDDQAICKRFFSFHDEHELCMEALTRHLGVAREQARDALVA